MSETGPNLYTADKPIDQREKPTGQEGKEKTETVVTPEAVTSADAKSHELAETYAKLHVTAATASPDALKAAGLPTPAEAARQIPQIARGEKTQSHIKLNVPGIAEAVGNALTEDSRKEDKSKARMEAAGILPSRTSYDGSDSNKDYQAALRATFGKTTIIQVPLPINKFLPTYLQ